MYKDRGYNTKLFASTPWDFDWGTFRSVAVSEWICKDKKYFAQLFKDDSFVHKTKDIWNELYPVYISKLDSYVDSLRNLNRNSVVRDRSFFPKPQDDTPTNLDNHVTYDDGADYVKQVLHDRIKWLNSQINTLPN